MCRYYWYRYFSCRHYRYRCYICRYYRYICLSIFIIGTGVIAVVIIGIMGGTY